MSHALLNKKNLLTFISITLFYFFESAQMGYYNVLAPAFLHHGEMQHGKIAAISAAYYYGDMIGLFPVGYALDKFPLRNTLIWALIGSIFGAFLLTVSDNFYAQWIARFICGFSGGAFSFLGGIRVIALVEAKRFTFFMGVFLAAGMLGGMLCQYPLLIVVQNFGPKAAMVTMFFLGLFAVLFNWRYLRPSEHIINHRENIYQGTSFQLCKEIGLNLRNWCDVLMVVMLDTPVSIIGTLWGIVFLMGFFNFDAKTSSIIVMVLFAGLMAGLPIWGYLADRYHYSSWIIIVGAGFSFCSAILLYFLQKNYCHAWMISAVFFFLGFFSSCQSLGFTWLTKNMKPELIGRNSAFNSMIFMGSNGALKQLGAVLLGTATVLIDSKPASNLLLIITASMLIAAIYASLRKSIFNVVI